MGEGPQAVRARAPDPVGRHRGSHRARGDEVPDAEERVVAGVALVEEVLGVGHERGGAQRVAHLVDVLALEVLEHRDRADEEVLAPVRGQAGVDPALRVGVDVGEQPVDLRPLLRVGVRLQADVRRVVAVVGVERVQAGASTMTSATMHRPATRPRPAGSDAQPRRPSGKRRRAASSTRRPRSTTPMPASRSPESCTPIWKRRMKMSLLPGTMRYSDAERRPSERHEQGHHPDAHQGAARHARAPARDAHPRPTPTRTVTTGQRPAS